MTSGSLQLAEFRASPQVGPGHNLSTSTHSTRFANHRRNLLLHQATCGVNGAGVRSGGGGGAIGTDDHLGPTCQRQSLAEPVRHQLSVILHHQQQLEPGDLAGSASEPARPSRVNRSSKAHQLRLDSNF